MNNFLYLIPTLFTVGNMLCGFFSIILSIENKFLYSGWAILIGILLDGFDGAVARLKSVTSVFGIEFDSLADFISFCVAPMVLVYKIFLYSYGTSGILLAFFYVLFGGLRLAKYNEKAYKIQLGQIEEPKKYVIEGLPTPASAGILVSLVLLFLSINDATLSKRKVVLLLAALPYLLNILPIIIVGLSILMVTKLQYMKFSKFRLDQKVTFKMFTIIVCGILLIFAYPETTIFLVFAIYILSGLVDYVIRFYKLKFHKRLIEKNE